MLQLGTNGSGRIRDVWVRSGTGSFQPHKIVPMNASVGEFMSHEIARLCTKKQVLYTGISGGKSWSFSTIWYQWLDSIAFFNCEALRPDRLGQSESIPNYIQNARGAGAGSHGSNRLLAGLLALDGLALIPRIQLIVQKVFSTWTWYLIQLNTKGWRGRRGMRCREKGMRRENHDKISKMH